jgi:hypothetical protein
VKNNIVSAENNQNIASSFKATAAGFQIIRRTRSCLVILINYCVQLNIMPRGKKKGLNTKKFDRCVTKVKRKGGAKNPYAICNASMGGKSKSNGKSRKH